MGRMSWLLGGNKARSGLYHARSPRFTLPNSPTRKNWPVLGRELLEELGAPTLRFRGKGATWTSKVAPGAPKKSGGLATLVGPQVKFTAGWQALMFSGRKKSDHYEAW